MVRQLRAFDRARQYRKERAAKAPGFKPILKMEAMMPVLEGKVPLAISAARASVIHDAIAFADKQRIGIVILQPRDIAKAGPKLKAKNIPLEISTQVKYVFITGKEIPLVNKQTRLYEKHMSRQ